MEKFSPMQKLYDLLLKCCVCRDILQSGDAKFSTLSSLFLNVHRSGRLTRNRKVDHFDIDTTQSSEYTKIEILFMFLRLYGEKCRNR